MENLFIIKIVLLIFILPPLQEPVFADYKHYIVYLGSHGNGSHLQGNPENVTRSHHDMISSATKRYKNDHGHSKRLIYSYTKIFNAFAATLDVDEAKELAKHPNVLSLFENRNVIGHTTHSWDFLSSFQHQHIPKCDTLMEKASHGEDMIIANFDSGVWPESESFKDNDFGPIPQKFKGQCDNENEPTAKCNRKLIGARYYHKGYSEVLASLNRSFLRKPSFRDMQGHGTHTLAIAGGNVVKNVTNKSLTLQRLGMKKGTVKGGAPRARVVAYKVLWPESNVEEGQGTLMDCLAAMEAAICDGVDVVSMSLGLLNVSEEKALKQFYFEDPISLGSFHAMANGVLVVAASGNSGPTPNTVTNISPWMLTVGASSFGREFRCDVVLGNRKRIRGARFLDEKLNETIHYPLISGEDARINGADPLNASYCTLGSLDPIKVKGKILFCLLEFSIDRNSWIIKGMYAKQSGAVGLIIANDKALGSKLLPDGVQLIATAHITYKHGKTILSYIKSTRTPTALITLPKPKVRVKPAPVVGDFSSRGPNLITPDILKPDVIAPGISVISAFSEDQNVKPYPETYLPGTGTSMAAPHVAGIAALIKKLHPNWSTSAIKSAIITTASPLDNKKKPILEDDMVHEATPFAIGAGLIQPNLAMDPGLVYDMNEFDYLNFLCGQHYNTTIMKKFTKQRNYNCPKSFNLMDFNYPSISISHLSGNMTITRRLKNVGQPSTYKARLKSPHGISILVKPKTLVFSRKDQEIKFKLIFSVTDISHPPIDYTFGSLTWSDGKHHVRSPIVVKVKNP